MIRGVLVNDAIVSREATAVRGGPDLLAPVQLFQLVPTGVPMLSVGFPDPGGALALWRRWRRCSLPG